MENYDVVTSDDKNVGHVVGTNGNNLIVEHGMIRKSKHAVPRDVVTVDESEKVVRLSVAKDVFEAGPSVKDEDEIDSRAVAEYYGIADGTAAPDTQGYGDVTAGDPARTAEQDARRFGEESPDEQRARIRDQAGPDADIATGPPKGSVGVHQDRWEVKE
jgi:hypothetical protein